MSNKKSVNKYMWHKGDTTMTVNGKQGKFVNGKFVSVANNSKRTSSKK